MNYTSRIISLRGVLAFFHDIFMAGLSFVIAYYLRLGSGSFQNVEFLLTGVLSCSAIAALVFYYMGLYRGVWRYASVRDLIAITKSTSLMVLITALVLFFFTRLEELPRSIPVIYWFVLMTLLGAPRFVYRLLKDGQFNLQNIASDITPVPVLLIGSDDAAELFLRALKRNSQIPYLPVGLITEKKQRVGMYIHGVQVIGSIDQLEAILARLEKEGSKPQRIILTRDDWAGEKVRSLFEIAEKAGILLSRLPKLTDLKSGMQDNIEVRPIDVEDLLGRPQKSLDKERPKQLIEDQVVLVTGAGGSIGSELVRQICQNKPRQVILLEASEYALYTIEMEVATAYTDIQYKAVICDVRNKDHLNDVFATYKPKLVFHAAALKHVPLVENNPRQGLYTNVLGSKNVADACRAHGVSAMVQISTDKAVNPTNVMGASKRIAEMYTQSLDLSRTNDHDCRFVTVRFGNVLGSTGSVVPLFQKQLVQGGPLTVTDERMTRFFMTIREAVELVLQASSLAWQANDLSGKICVLDMGEPVRILNLAEQMIRLAGFEPYHDIDIKITGLRPGEKLYEEVFHGEEKPMESEIKGILIAKPRSISHEEMEKYIARLLALPNDLALVKKMIKEIVPEFTSPNN